MQAQAFLQPPNLAWKDANACYCSKFCTSRSQASRLPPTAPKNMGFTMTSLSGFLSSDSTLNGMQRAQDLRRGAVSTLDADPSVSQAVPSSAGGHLHPQASVHSSQSCAPLCSSMVFQTPPSMIVFIDTTSRLLAWEKEVAVLKSPLKDLLFFGNYRKCSDHSGACVTRHIVNSW